MLKADASLAVSAGVGPVHKSKMTRKLNDIKKNAGLYLLLFPTLFFVGLFSYGPMYGIQIAFKDFSVRRGIMGSEWMDPLFHHFIVFFSAHNFWQLLWNTLALSLYTLIIGFPIPIIFALLLNYLRFPKFKKVVQTVSYAPFFISTVVKVGMITVFFHNSTGLVNIFINLLGFESIRFIGTPEYFRHLFVWTGIWQTMGWSAIIYIAALAGVSPEFHEAAIMDGATKFKRMLHIDLPTILPTVVILLILNVGNLMAVGFEKAFLMQNNLNLEVSEVIATYVYKIGLLNAQHSFATAVGLFNSVVNLILLLLVNLVARKMADISLF